MLKKYCAWHKKYFGKELFMGGIPAERDGTTHGICDECQKLIEKETIEFRKKYRSVFDTQNSGDTPEGDVSPKADTPEGDVSPKADTRLNK